MKKKIQIIPSGISLVDKAWGGFYRGGTYLMIGQRKSGRTLLGLQYAMETAKQKRSLFVFYQYETERSHDTCRID